MAITLPTKIILSNILSTGVGVSAGILSNVLFDHFSKNEHFDVITFSWCSGVTVLFLLLLICLISYKTDAEDLLQLLINKEKQKLTTSTSKEKLKESQNEREVSINEEIALAIKNKEIEKVEKLTNILKSFKNDK